MALASSRIVINAPTHAIWQVIRDFSAADQYLSGVVNCTVEGEAIGTLRTLTSADGSTVVERLESMNVTFLQLSYSLLTDTPFGNSLTTMAIRDLSPSQAELTWSASFQPVGIPASEAVDLMASALAANCLALKQFMETDRR